MSSPPKEYSHLRNRPRKSSILPKENVWRPNVVVRLVNITLVFCAKLVIAHLRSRGASPKCYSWLHSGDIVFHHNYNYICFVLCFPILFSCTIFRCNRFISEMLVVATLWALLADVSSRQKFLRNRISCIASY